jgi:hypothetical protein
MMGYTPKCRRDWLAFETNRLDAAAFDTLVTMLGQVEAGKLLPTRI